MSSKMTRSEKERRQAVKENERAAKKKKKEASKSSSSSKIEKIAKKQFGKQEEEKKSLAERFAEATKNLNISRKTQQQEEKKQKKIKVSEEKRYNPLTRTAVRTPDRDVSYGNTGRTREELERRKSTRELAQMDADDWLRKSREQAALKDNEKAGVGLGTIQHGNLNKNAEYFTNNWSSIPGGYQVDAAIQMIYSNGVNNANSRMIMSAFENASTYDKRKIMDAVVQTDGWSDVAYDMKRKINNAPDAEKALMQQISEDMSRENYLDTFNTAANKAIIDQNTLRQKEDKVIADWAKENYDLGEAMKYRTLETGASFVNNMSDAVSMGISDLLQAGQQESILDGINPFEGVGDAKGLDKIAKFGTNVLHDLFRLAGINVSVLSKAMLTQDDVDKISNALMGLTDQYHEAVRNNMVALDGSQLSKAEKDLVEVYGMVIEQIPSIVMSLVASPAAGLATTGVTAGGKYARSAYEQGATLEQAVQFGLSGAAAEVASEKIFTGFGYFGKGLSHKLLTETTRKMIDGSKFKNSVAADMLKRVIAGGGEATEEMIVEILTPYLERSTYDPTADGATVQEVLRSGGLGFVVAQILGLPANALGVTDSVMRKMDTRRHEEMVLNQVEGEIADALTRGEISEMDAANINAQISDYRKGKGSLMDSQAKSEAKVTGEDLGTVYANSNEAREAMAEEAKGKANGEKVTARFVENGKVRTWNGTVFDGKVNAYHEGITTQAENEKYTAKAQKVASATNTAERTGYQLNVKDEIVKEVSALSKALNTEIEFISRENAVHGYEQNGKIYVNANSDQSPVAAVIAHEMTHLLEGTSSYSTLQGMMQNFYKNSLADKKAEIVANYKAAGIDLSDTQADAEVMAMFVEEKLLTDYDTIRQITTSDRTVAQKIVDWINKVIQKITGSKEQRFLIEARDMWSRALKEEQNAPSSVSDKPTDDAVEEVMYSYGKNDQLMDNAEKRNKTTKAVEQEDLDSAREARETIRDNYSHLFIPDNMGKKSPLVGNDSYAGSLDNTTICTRSLTMESIVELVANKLGRPLRNEESIVVAQELMEYTGDRAECLYCYQANAKRGYEDALANFIDQRRTVIDNHRNGMDEDTNYKLMMNYDFEKNTWGKKDTPAARERFNTFIKIADGKLTMAPAFDMINTRVLNEKIQDKKTPDYIKTQLKQARTYAQGAVKAHGRVYYSVYNGQILKVKQEKVDDWNRTYGLRMYSFSDFSPAFILENMQMVTDAAVRGLRMLAYTKEPEFVSIFGDTGMAINISVAGVPDGNGGYHSDGMQGMNWETAKALRDRYPETGTVYVAKDDAEVKWAMAQDWIDTVIPFHISYGSGMMQRSMGWKNYSGQQSEKKEKGWTSDLKKTIYPSEHQNDKDTYIRLCEENKLTPKFPQFLGEPNYMKLVNETRRSPNKMRPVQPIFDVEAAERTLDAFSEAGGYNPILGGSESNREYIAEEITRKVKERAPEVKAHDRKYSIGRPTDTKAERKKQNRLDEATMREFDRLMKQRSEDERKDAEATMRMHDKLIKEVYDEAKSLSAEEKREIRKNVKEEDKERMKKELAARAAKYRKERSNARKNLNEVLKEAEKQRKDYERKLAAPEKEAMRKKQREVDAERRKERLRIARDEYKRNNPKPEEGSREALFFKNYDARRLAEEFRIETITKLVNMGQFVETNGEVVLDENGMEIAVRNADTNKWDASRVRNTYTPTWGLSLLAEKEGIDKDVFYTIYSKIADMRTKRDENGNLVYKKKDIVDYIISLNLTAKQKEFLYFDAAKYAYIKRPAFLSGGRVNEKAGNKRGRMIEALDNIAMDMYSGVMSDEYFENAQIREEDITVFVDVVFGKEDSEKKNLFTADFLGMIEEYTTQMETARMAERTKLLTDKPKEKNSIKMQILRSYRESKRLFVAEGEAFERMGAKMENPLLTARYYAAKKSSAIANEMIYGKTQRDFNGKKQGKSLYEIFKPVFRADEKAGNNKNMTELTELVNCRHDIYRLRNGKGYTGYSIEECERIVDRISKENHELLKVADEIVEYGRNLLKLCVYSGRISQQDYDYFTTKYPYYAPTFRLRSNEYIDRKGNVVRRDTKVIRTAVGGSDDVLPLFDQFVRRTQEIVKSCKKNQLASEMAKMIYNPHFGEYIKEVRLSENQEEKELMLSSIGELEDIGRARKEDGMGNVIPWYANGKKYDIEVADEALLYGWDRITYRRNEYAIATAFRKLNNIRRGVLTQYNPTFFITNGIKDIQDMYLYNQHAQRLPKFHLEAAKTMFAGTFGKGENEEALEEYLSYGMSQASIFEYDNTNSGRRTKRDRVASVMRKPLDAFNALNFMVEQTPRLAVYNEAVDRLTNQRKKGGNTYSNEEIKTIAAYQASDATLNFGRSGTVIKEMNTYGFTFINAGVQGMDRFRRMFTQVKDGNKKALYINMLGLVIKMGIIGMGWNVLTDWIYGGDDEYAEAIRNALFDDPEKVMQEYSEMADYQRTNYLLIYINGTWIRVPKGRLASFIYGFEYNGVKVAEGEMDALDLVMAQFDLAAETILFSNPITNNILGPFVDIWRNKDAWGVDIVSEYDDMGEGFHYLESDEETTDLAVKIAEFGHKLTADLFGEEKARILDISPKKLDYLIEQYLGSYANVIMPFLNKEQNLKDNAIGALQSMIQKFYIDPTSSNRLAGDYYDLKEEYENIANAHENDSPYAVAAKVFADYTTPLKELREEINAIDADNSLTRKEKLEKISALREEMNDLYRQGVADAKSALAYAKENYYGADENSETYEQWEQLTKGAEWQISTMSDSAQEKWKSAEAEGIDADSFVSAYNFIKNATGDKDENGKTITGSKKAKVVKHINSLPITAEQKLYLYFDLGGYSENGDIPAFSNGSVGSGVSANMASPISGGGTITSKYGYRNTGIPGASNYHQAVDIAAPQGTDVGATMSGTVTKVTSSGGYGNSVEITSKDEDGNTIVTKYSHLANFGVAVGDVIAQGKKIGEVGSTGVSSGAHLDFKLSINGEWVDPLLYVDLAGAGIVDAVGYTQKEGAVSSGYSGGSSSQTSRKTATTAERKSTNYDSVAKLGSSSGTSGGRVVLPTASEYAAIQARNVSGRSTKSATYGAKGTYLPKASDYSPQKRSIGTSVAKTQRTGRTGGSLWDENVLS